VDITQIYDGDSRTVKRAEVDTIYEDGGTSHTETNTLYQLRSSVLGGKVLTEIGAQGQKARTYVYADGALLAWQSVIYVNGTVTAQVAVWEHRDPSDASYRTSQANGSSDPENAAELDPFGSNAGLENPYQLPMQSHKPNIFYPAMSLMADSACMVDGLAQNCGLTFYMLGAGTAEICPNNNCGPQPVYDRDRNKIVLRPLTQDPDTGQFGYYALPLTVNELLPKNMRQKKPQNTAALAPNGLASKGKLSDKECDDYLARIFGGPDARVGSTRDPDTLLRNAGTPRPQGHGPAPFDNPNPNSSDRGGIIHIYGNPQGTATDAPLYAPRGGNMGPRYTHYDDNGDPDYTGRRVTYGTGLTISFVHVGPSTGGRRGSVLVGGIGGLGGDRPPGYIHTHIIFYSDFNKKIRVDPRKVFCGQ
jgi:hypothetical protein